MTKTIATIILFTVALVVFFAFNNAQVTIADEKTASDINQVREALKIFYDENAYYPTSINAMPVDIEKYLEYWPVPSNPRGICKNFGKVYRYESISGGTDYRLSYCLISSGVQIASSKGIR